MADLRNETPSPTEINLHAKSRVLEIAFSDGNVFRLPFEFLRVFSPSAEVKGHGPGQETLQGVSSQANKLSLIASATASRNLGTFVTEGRVTKVCRPSLSLRTTIKYPNRFIVTKQPKFRDLVRIGDQRTL